MDDKDSRSDDGIELVEVSSITPHNRALLDAGKSILVDSTALGRDFCKFMISFSIGAVPVYLGLLKFVLPENQFLSRRESITALIPAILFLFSSVLFVIGYFPRVSQLSLDVPSEIEVARTRIIKKRIKLIRCGFSTFLLGSLSAIFNVIIHLGLK